MDICLPMLKHFMYIINFDKDEMCNMLLPLFWYLLLYINIYVGRYLWVSHQLAGEANYFIKAVHFVERP